MNPEQENETNEPAPHIPEPIDPDTFEPVPFEPKPLEVEPEEVGAEEVEAEPEIESRDHTRFAVHEYSPVKQTLGYIKLFVASFILIALIGIVAYFIMMAIVPDKPTTTSTTAKNEITPTTAYPLSSGSQSTSTSTSTQPSEVATSTEPTGSIAIASTTLPNETFKSKINKKVSFSVPVGSTVTESGTAAAIKFNIQSQDNKAYVMTYSKVAEGCFDGIGSFRILSGQGVDYRIIQENDEIVLNNKMHALRLFEMYGSYAGQVGFRGNACIQSAIPTRVEIKANGYDRRDSAKAYQLFEEMIHNITV